MQISKGNHQRSLLFLEYLKENNAMMESQYQTMLTWKERIHQSNVFNQQKADDAKNLIQRIQATNADMEAQIKEVYVVISI